MKKIIIIAIALFTITLLKAEKTATINIKKNEFHKDSTSRDVLGGFYEQIADFVSGPCGFSAEEIVNRGFDYVIYNDTLPKGLIYAWVRKETDSSRVFEVWESYNKNGLLSVLFDQKNNEEINIKQKLILSDSCNYNFYVYAKSLSGTSGTINIKLQASKLDGSVQVIDSKDIVVTNGNWNKYEILLNGVFTDSIMNSTSELIITPKNNSKIQIDETSLMQVNNVHGARSEQADLFRKAKFGLLRYPGGWFADSDFNRWKNELLPRDQRRSTFFVGLSNDPQRVEFGILEYMKFCKELNIKPYLTVNIHFGTSDDAADLIEFCNGDTNTKYGKIRMQLGDTLPYKVKYWEIGNENWKNKLSYTQKYIEFYDKMVAKDSSITTIINGNAWDETSFDSLMNIVGEKCTIFGYHTSKVLFNEPKSKNFKKYLYSVETQNEINLIELYKSKIAKLKSNPNLKLGNTEWWTSIKTDKIDWIADKDPANFELKSSFWSTGASLIYLNNPELFKVGCRTMGINFIKREINSKGKKAMYGTPAFHSFSMISNHFAPKVHLFDVVAEKFSNYEAEVWVIESSYLDALVASNSDTLYVYVNNKYPDDPVNISLFADSMPVAVEATKYELWSEDYNDMNTPDEPNKIVEKVYKNVSINKNVTLKPHSFNIFAIPIEYKNGKLEINTIDLSVDDGNSLLNDLSNLKFNVSYINNSKHIEIASEIELRNISVEVYSSAGELVSNNNYFNFDKLNYLNANLLSGAYYVKISNAKNDFMMLPLMVVN